MGLFCPYHPVMRYWLLIIAFILFGAFIDGRIAALEERLQQDTDTHTTKAALLAACLNGKALTDGERTVDCTVRKK